MHSLVFSMPVMSRALVVLRMSVVPEPMLVRPPKNKTKVSLHSSLHFFHFIEVETKDADGCVIVVVMGKSNKNIK